MDIFIMQFIIFIRVPRKWMKYEIGKNRIMYKNMYKCKNINKNLYL